MKPDLLSIVVPVYNEAESIYRHGCELIDYCKSQAIPTEFIFVNDGSRDQSQAELERLARDRGGVRIISYQPNRGLGAALRRGFATSEGEYILTIDADLSYAPDHIPVMLETLKRDVSLDCVVGSVYSPGGRAENVPFWRLFLSRFGNRVLSVALHNRLHTITCILRCYRASSLKRLTLFSTGKEIHLEIIAKAISMGWALTEVPSRLVWEAQKKRRRGGFRLKSVMLTHLLFSFSERPMILFGWIGALFMGVGLLFGGYLVYLWSIEALNPNRPLFTLVTLLIVTGIQIVLFGFLGIELSNLRREILRLQRRERD